LGIFIPLIVVNCIILARAEMFASKNSVIPSILDAIGMGAGFTLALVMIGSFREFLGNGSLFGVNITADLFDPAVIMILPPGGFLAFGIIIGLINKFSAVKVQHNSCHSCPVQCGAKSDCKEAGV